MTRLIVIFFKTEAFKDLKKDMHDALINFLTVSFTAEAQKQQSRYDQEALLMLHQFKMIYAQQSHDIHVSALKRKEYEADRSQFIAIYGEEW